MESRPALQLTAAKDVIGLIVAIGALLYPIGFAQLVARVGMGYTHDLTTAWLAASMVPAVDAVGQGVTVIRDEWSALVFLITLVALNPVMSSLPPKRPDLSQPEARRVWVRANRILAWFGAVVLIAVVVIDLVFTHSGGLLIGMTLGIATGLLEAWLASTRARRPALVHWAVVSGVVYVAITMLAFLPPISLEPALPNVQTSSGVTGRFVTHSEGYWYVITRAGHLVAVPDQEAGRVQIQP